MHIKLNNYIRIDKLSNLTKISIDVSGDISDSEMYIMVNIKSVTENYKIVISLMAINNKTYGSPDVRINMFGPN